MFTYRWGSGKSRKDPKIPENFKTCEKIMQHYGKFWKGSRKAPENLGKVSERSRKGIGKAPEKPWKGLRKTQRKRPERLRGKCWKEPGKMPESHRGKCRKGPGKTPERPRENAALPPPIVEKSRKIPENPEK